MQKNSRKRLAFTSARKQFVEVDVEEGAVVSHAGLLLVRETDRKAGLIHSI